MRRFFVDEIRPIDRSVTIRGAEARHMATVLRMGPGDRIVLMDSAGKRFEAIIKSSSRHEVLVTLEKPVPPASPSPIQITLCQALLKSMAMDYLVQKTSELGVERILLFLSERTVMRLRTNAFSNKLRRWREIARAAATQSDRIKPAEIGPIVSFRELLDQRAGEDEIKVILWEGEDTRDLKSLLRSSPPAERIVGMVGPEGGFSPDEIIAAREAGFVPVSLGRRVLRAETAAITLVALLQYERGDLSLTTT
jgi:16S rRNA (uracil1498-N3)-methyltransferase